MMNGMPQKPAFGAIAALLMAAGSLAGTLILASCTAKIISPNPAPTNTPTVTHTPQNTATNTPSPTITSTPNETATFAGTATVILTATPSPTPSSTPSATPTATSSGLGAGSIAFTGLTYNGNSEVSFINLVAIPASEVIYFTNYSYDVTANSGAGGLVDESISCCGITSPSSNGLTVIEGTVSWTAPGAGLPALTQVVFGKNIPLGTIGTMANVAGAGGSTYLVLNHNGNGHKVLAFTVPSAGVTNWLAGVIFGPDTWQTSGSISTSASYGLAGGSGPAFWDSYLPPGLDVTTSTDLSSAWAAGDGSGSFNAAATVSEQNDNAVVSCQNTLSGVVNPSNWSVDANQSKTAVNINPVSITGVAACSSNYGGYSGSLPVTTY